MDNQTFVNEKITEYLGWTAESLAAPVKEDTYGYSFLAKTHQWYVEAYAYRQCKRGDPKRLFHMVNMIKLDLPDFVFTSRGYINSECLRLLNELCSCNDVGIAGAASSGKTYPVAAYRLENWKSSPHNTLDFVCTTSMGASEQRIWGAIVSLFQSSAVKDSKGNAAVGTYIPHKHAIVFGRFSEDADQRDFRSAIIALAIEKGNEGKKAIDTTRGRKQTHVSITFDELPEMESYVTNALVNLEANDDLEATYIGNPHRHGDPHGEALKPDHPLGYDSINKNTKWWKTRTGTAIFMNGEWSANFQAPPDEPPPFKGLIDRVKIDRMLKRCHGNRNSLDFWRNAIGFWPDITIGRTVLTKELILSCGADKKTNWLNLNRTPLCGFDSGFTAGGDKCVAQYGELGQSDLRRNTLRWLFEVEYEPVRGQVFEESIAKQLVNDLIKYSISPSCFGMDISGDGGKMLREIIRAWLPFNRNAAEIVPISSMGAPTDRIYSSVDPRPCKDVFDRRVSEYWMNIREGVSCRVINNLPLYQEDTNETHPLISQLCEREYSIRGRKLALETKDEMKERTQGRSPDNADAFSYLVEMARRHGLIFTAPAEEKTIEQRRVVYRRRARLSMDYASNGWGED